MPASYFPILKDRVRQRADVSDAQFREHEALSSGITEARVLGVPGIVPGFGFIEDTSSFHKATPPKTRDRLLLQFVYY